MFRNFNTTYVGLFLEKSESMLVYIILILTNNKKNPVILFLPHFHVIVHKNHMITNYPKSDKCWVL
ncbi:hypothetical protein HanIR_Chr01g0032301 [Helianthus annuus]|nr:hypothetical protein HanIR_Chr01g0032301 [Helianthus annuus]